MEAVFDLPAGQFKKKSGTVGTDVAIFIFTAHESHDFKKDYVTFIKLLKDEVGTKGNLKGVASTKTDRIYKRMLEFAQSGYRDLSILKNRVYFAEPLTVLLEKGKYMYRNYEPKPDIIPTEEDFMETVGEYLEFLLMESYRIMEEEADDDI